MNDKSQKISTVSLVTLFSGIIDEVQSFNDNREGNEEVEKLFKEKILKEYLDLTDEDIENYMDDGHFEGSKIEFAIVHSV